MNDLIIANVISILFLTGMWIQINLRIDCIEKKLDSL